MKHSLKLTQQQADKICKPVSRFGKTTTHYRQIRGTSLLLWLPHMLVVSQRYNVLTSEEYELVLLLLNPPKPDKNPTQAQLDRAWSQTAIRDELEALGRAYGDNPHIPGSQIFSCFLRIGSIIKGSGKGHFSSVQVVSAILNSLPLNIRTKGRREHDIKYLFYRALKYSKPRYRITK